MLLHVVTRKGRGYAPAEAAPDKYHGVSKFDVVTGQPIASHCACRLDRPTEEQVVAALCGHLAHGGAR